MPDTHQQSMFIGGPFGHLVGQPMCLYASAVLASMSFTMLLLNAVYLYTRT